MTTARTERPEIGAPDRPLSPGETTEDTSAETEGDTIEVGQLLPFILQIFS